jgi:uncharacterized membrane protein required for colicin V production
VKEGLTYYYYILNLSILTILLYRVSIGWKGGLFNESTNLVIFLFSSGLTIAFFEPLGSLLNSYFCPNRDLSALIALWLIFIAAFTGIWILKSYLMEKVFRATRQRTIPFPKPLDRLGGAACGLALGTLILGLLISSLYIAPLSEDFYAAARLKDSEVLFHLDEVIPRSYGAVMRKLPPQARFGNTDFLSNYRREKTTSAEEDGEELETRERSSE